MLQKMPIIKETTKLMWIPNNFEIYQNLLKYLKDKRWIRKLKDKNDSEGQNDHFAYGIWNLHF